jgi:prophage antirepressor-like protein
MPTVQILTDHKAHLINLIKRNPAEFDSKTLVVKLTTSHPNSPGELIINYHGVIRAAMLSDAPRAKEFRDWKQKNRGPKAP